MAKKTKETKPKEAKPKKEPKPKAPVDPVKTANLVRLLNILALLIAIIAFLLQLFAVLGHHWKRQSTSFYPIVSPNNNAPPTVYEDSRLDQTYGLFSREVKLFANNDQLEQLWSGTRFPRLDNGDDALNHCLTRSTSLRGALLSCSDQVISPEQCSCRRHPYWNAVIVFEILALIFLGIVVVLVALQTTHLHGILKPAAAGLALLAFIFLLIGLILILSYLKRETRSLADAYPHIYGRLLEKLTVFYNPNRAQPYYQSALRRALRRQAPETYRVYTLLQGQHPFNETHFQEYSETARAWVYRPYTSLVPAVPYASFSSDSRYSSSGQRNSTTTTTTTTTVSYNPYGPTLGYDQVFERTKARIGCSTVLSILAMILSLLLPLIVIFSWLKEKALSTNTKTVTTTTVKTEYVPVPQDVPPESVPLNTVIPTEYDPRRPIGEAIITTQNVPQMVYDSYTGRNEPVIVRDVIIRDENPSAYAQQYAIPVRNN